MGVGHGDFTPSGGEHSLELLDAAETWVPHSCPSADSGFGPGGGGQDSAYRTRI